MKSLHAWRSSQWPAANKKQSGSRSRISIKQGRFAEPPLLGLSNPARDIARNVFVARPYHATRGAEGKDSDPSNPCRSPVHFFFKVSP